MLKYKKLNKLLNYFKTGVGTGELKMKKTLILLTLVLALGVISIQYQRYWVRQNRYVSQVLWNENECYIFCAINTSGWSGNYLSELYISLREFLGLYTVTKNLREDTIVWHFVNGNMSKYYIKNFRCGGFSPYNGIIHRFIGGEAPLSVWRWTGSDFEKLNQEEGDKIRGSFKLVNELLAKEKWSEYYSQLGFNIGETKFAIKLRDYDLELILIGDQNLIYKQVVVKEPKRQEKEYLREDFSNIPQRIDKKTYFEFAESKESR